MDTEKKETKTNIDQWIFNSVFAARLSGVTQEELIERIKADWLEQDQLWIEEPDL